MTFGTMKDRITDELTRSDLSAQAKNAIVSAIEFYENDQFWFNDSRATIDTVASQEYYGLPTDFLDVHIITITTNDYKYKLIPRTYQWMEEHRSNANWENQPTDYAIYAGQLRLFPIPNDAYRLDLSYQKKLTEISASASVGATNAWMTSAEELIRTHAKVDLLESVIRGPDAEREAARLRAREDQVYSRLTQQETRRRSTNRLRPQGVLVRRRL